MPAGVGSYALGLAPQYSCKSPLKQSFGLIPATLNPGQLRLGVIGGSHRLDVGLIGRGPLFGLLAGVDGGRLACVIP